MKAIWDQYKKIMENKLNLQSKSYKDYFQSDFFLDEKNSIYVYDFEQIKKRDKIYSLIRRLEEIDWNTTSNDENLFIEENEYVYDIFLKNLNSIIEITDENLILNEFYLENNKLPELKELAQLSKWVKTSKEDLKRGSVFVEDLEFLNFERKYCKSLKIKQEFIEAHFYLCLDIAWKYNGGYTGKDIIELSLIGKSKLYDSFEDFCAKLKLIKKDWLEKYKNKKKPFTSLEEEETKSISDEDFDRCIYAFDYLEAYFDFIENTKKNIEIHVSNYLINHIGFSEKRKLVFQR